MGIDKMFEKLPYNKLYSIPVWQRLAALFAVSGLLIGCFYLLIVQGMDADIDALEQNLAQIKKQVDDNRLHAKKLGKLKEKVAALQKKMDKASEQLPTKKEIPNLLEQVSNIGTKVGLEVITFKPQKEQKKDFYYQVPVSMKVAGKFHNIMMFFDEIANLRRIVTMGNIKIKKEKKSSRLILECQANTYRFLEKKEVKKGKGKKNGKNKKKSKL